MRWRRSWATRVWNAHQPQRVVRMLEVKPAAVVSTTSGIRPARSRRDLRGGLKGRHGHREAVRVLYVPARVGYAKLAAADLLSAAHLSPKRASARSTFRLSRVSPALFGPHFAIRATRKMYAIVFPVMAGAADERQQAGSCPSRASKFLYSIERRSCVVEESVKSGSASSLARDRTIGASASVAGPTRPTMAAAG